MIYQIILFIISCLLIYGAWNDWHRASVSNKITFPAIAISLLSIPFVDNLTTRLLFIGFYFIMFIYTPIGGADIKILIAVLLTVPSPFLFMSLFVIFSAIIFIQMRMTGRNTVFARISNGNNKPLEERIPGFVPITMSYIVTIVLTLTASIYIS